MLTILTYISFITGGLLIIMLLLSLLGGLDLDFDIGDADADGGGLGIIKGGLTFISVSCWVTRIIIHTSENPIVAIIVGIVSGVVAVLALSFMLRLFLKAEAEVNWSPDQALYNKGKVYLKIPEGTGYGLVHTLINGTSREIKAKSLEGEIPTGATVYISDIQENILIVNIIEENKS